MERKPHRYVHFDIPRAAACLSATLYVLTYTGAAPPFPPHLCLPCSCAEFAGFAQMLAAGIYGGHMAQAAELLAFAKPSWPFKARAQRMFLDIIHPACSLFCGRTSDSPPQPRPQTCDKGANGNWCVLAICSRLFCTLSWLPAGLAHRGTATLRAAQGYSMHERSFILGSLSG